MLAELRILVDHVAAGAAARNYTESIIDENILGKPTRAARQKTAKRLRELYGVDPHCTLFRLLRHFWTVDTKSQPMLAFLVAAARDPLLRETTPIVQEIPLGQAVSSTEIAQRLAEKYPQRFSPTTQLSTAQNLASSWSQAGYLKGRAMRPSGKTKHLLGAAPLQQMLGAISRLTVDTPQLQVLPLYRVATFGNEPIDVFLS